MYQNKDVCISKWILKDYNSFNDFDKIKSIILQSSPLAAPLNIRIPYTFVMGHHSI